MSYIYNRWREDGLLYMPHCVSIGAQGGGSCVLTGLAAEGAFSMPAAPWHKAASLLNPH